MTGRLRRRRGVMEDLRMLTLEQQEAMRQETLNEKGTEVSVLRSAKGKEKRLRPLPKGGNKLAGGGGLDARSAAESCPHRFGSVCEEC
jgi:hypothetical protein